MALPATEDFNGAGNQITLTTFRSTWTAALNAFTVDPTGYAFSETVNSECGVFWNADSFAADQYSQAVFTGTSNQGLYNGVCVRASTTGGGAYYAAYYAAVDGLFIVRIRNGAYEADINGSTGVTFASGDTIRLEVSGTGATVTLTVKKNGTTVLSGTDTTANRLLSGSAGVAGYSGSQNSLRLDSWEGGNLSGAASISGTGAAATGAVTVAGSGTVNAGSPQTGTGAPASSAATLAGTASLNVAGQTQLLTTPNSNSAYRITAFPDAVAGDTIEWGFVVGGTLTGVYINPDLTFNSDGNITQFQVRLYDVSLGEWSSWVVQNTSGPGRTRPYITPVTGLRAGNATVAGTGTVA